MVILSLCKKSPNDKITIAFNFATSGSLHLTEKIVEHGIQIRLFSGNDQDPKSILYEPPTIDPNHPHKILQKIQGGVPGSTYQFTVRVRTDQNHIYEMRRLLVVDN